MSTRDSLAPHPSDKHVLLYLICFSSACSWSTAAAWCSPIARARTCWIRGMSLHCRSHSTTMHSSSIMKRRSCSVSYHEASCWAIIAIFIFKNPHLVSILVVCMHFKKFVVEIIRLHFCLSVNNFQPLIPEKKARFVASRLT